MALLHANVKPFQDPKKYLHEPERDLNLKSLLEKLVSTNHFRKNLLMNSKPARSTFVTNGSSILYLHG
jgi:hypothetical protein